MFVPKFVISNKLLRLISQIEVCRDFIERTPISGEDEKKMVAETVIKKIYFGSHIEGNELTLSQTRQILEGPTQVAQNRDVQEVINYKRVLNIIDEISISGKDYLEDWLRDLHAAITYNILPPEKSGFLRSTQVLIRDDESKDVIFTPPTPDRVPAIISDFISWLNMPESRDIHPVIRASIALYSLLIIRPFVEQNDTVAELFGGLILYKEGYSVRKLLFWEEQIEFSLDEYFNVIWGDTLQANSYENRDLTPIIEYIAQIILSALQVVKEDVVKTSTAAPSRVKVGEQVALSARQIRIIDFISENGRAVMKELKTIIPNVSDDTILRDLTALYKKGIIEKEGTTKAASYILKK